MTIEKRDTAAQRLGARIARMSGKRKRGKQIMENKNITDEEWEKTFENIIKNLSNQQNPLPEFEVTFKEHYWDLLA